jgi:mersacidin/lichenicidin family type 2 lantibiotic
MSHNRNAGYWFTTWFILGALVGAAAGILLALKRGRETRGMVGDQARNWRDRLFWEKEIIRAWTDEEYRLSLSEEERALLPDNPAGLPELSDPDLERYHYHNIGDLFEFNLSLLHPRKLSKRLSSPFMILIYPPEKSQEANVWITKERRKWLGQRQQLEEHEGDAELPTIMAVNIRMFSPAIDFSGEKTKVLLEDQLNSLHFTGQPKDTCTPGIHAAVLSITNKKTGQEYKSMSFPVTVVDFAFDHVSSPWLSNLTSAVLGVASAATFVLTFLGQVDQTLGLASGGAAGAVASFIHMRYLSLYKLPRTSVVD